MKNYICIEGKCAELTPEQLELLGIKVKEKSPFERVERHDTFYCIGNCGEVNSLLEFNDNTDKSLYIIANYCTDKALMEQRALHEILNRLLWRYSMEHDGDKIDWGSQYSKYYIYRNNGGAFHVDFWSTSKSPGMIYFYNSNIAKNAIKEIIEPFMKEHPEFKW
jgi:hypothetical protein